MEPFKTIAPPAVPTYSPKKQYPAKAELHITYRCNLQCVNCNRASFLREEHTPDMTVEDVKEFFRQAKELDYNPSIMIIGGEPTMHPNFEEIVKLAREFKGWPSINDSDEVANQKLVQVWTNGRDRKMVDLIRRKYRASVPEESYKAKSRTDFPWDDYFVSPADFGKQRPKCWQHGSEICGISVDSGGYMPCAVGGMIDGMLGLGLRTKRLADLFDEEKNAALTEKMCEHCGACVSQIVKGDELTEWRAYVESLPKKFGAHMSPTWYEASKNRK